MKIENKKLRNIAVWFVSILFGVFAVKLVFQLIGLAFFAVFTLVKLIIFLVFAGVFTLIAYAFVRKSFFR